MKKGEVKTIIMIVSLVFNALMLYCLAVLCNKHDELIQETYDADKYVYLLESTIDSWGYSIYDTCGATDEYKDYYRHK